MIAQSNATLDVVWTRNIATKDDDHKYCPSIIVTQITTSNRLKLMLQKMQCVHKRITTMWITTRIRITAATIAMHNISNQKTSNNHKCNQDTIISSSTSSSINTTSSTSNNDTTTPTNTIVENTNAVGRITAQKNISMTAADVSKNSLCLCKIRCARLSAPSGPAAHSA